MKDFLDKDRFRKSVAVLAARVPAVKTGLILRSNATRRSNLNHAFLRNQLTISISYIIDIPRIRSVVPNPTDPDEGRLVLLRVANEGMRLLVCRYEHPS